MAKARLTIKRIYDPPADGDGLRVLVDRVWPRGVRKDDAQLDAWLKELAPSDALRKWFAHDPARFEVFAERYRAELDEQDDLIARCLGEWRGKRVTLLYGARDTEHNQAVVLQAVFTERA